MGTLLALRVIAGALLLLLMVVLGWRAAPVRRALVRIAMPILNRSLAGHIQLSSLDGDLTRSLIIHDLKIDDAEGVQALYARRIEVHFDLAALWHHTVQIDDLDVVGAEVRIRHLADDRVNLAALPRSPSAPATKSSPVPSDPLRLVVKHLRLRFDGGYDPPRGHEGQALERPRGSFDLEGSADVHGAEVTVRVDHLISDAREPLAAHVELSGGLKVDPPRAAGGHTELTFVGVKVTVAAEGREIERIHPGLKAAGRWKVSVDGAGPLSALKAHVLVEPPTGTLHADGTLSRTWPGVKWAVHATATGLQPADDWRGLQSGRVDFDLAAVGDPAAGHIEVARFDAVSGELRVHASGGSDFAGAGNAGLVASAGDLRQLASLGLPGLAGDARLVATLRRAGGRSLFDGAIHAHRLRMAGASVAALDARWSAADWSGTARIDAREIRTEQLALAELSIAARSDGRQLRSRIDLRRDDDARARIELAATPRREGPRLAGADVVIDTLVASSRSGHFRLSTPARLHLFGSPTAPALDGELLGIVLHIRGQSSPGQLIANLSVDVANLATLGSSRLAGGLAGQLHLTAHVVKGATLRVDATVHGGGLRLWAARIETLEAHLNANDLAGVVHVAIGRLAAPGLIAETLVLDGKSDAQRLALTVEGHGPAHSALAVAVDGTYLRRGARPVGAELRVRTLTIAVGGEASEAWALARPALVHVGTSLILEGLVLSSMNQSLAVEGRYGVASGAIDLKLVAHDLQPASFARLLGVKEALSVTMVSGRVHLSGTLHAPSLQASLQAISDKKVGWYGLAFNRLSIALSAGRDRLLVHLDAGGSGSAQLALDARGAPQWKDDQLLGIDATVERLRLTANEQVWQLGSACRLRFDRAVTIDACKLVAGKQEIAIHGLVPLDAGPMDATLVTRELDLRTLGALLAPGHKEPPTTSFNARLHASGTRKAPLLDVELSGHGSQIDEGLPENVDYRVRAHYGEGRINGEVAARQLGTKLGIGARFDLPTSFAQSDDRPLRLELEARPVPFFKIRDSLPPAIAGLRGFFTLGVRVSGTTRHPVFNAELHAPSWDLDDLSNNDTVVNLTYDGTLLRGNSVTSFAATSFVDSLLRIRPKRNAGTVKVELTAPIDLGRLLSKPREMLSALMHDTQLSASAELKGVELQRVPLQMLGVATPFTTGLVDGALRWSGTLDAPSVHARLSARGLGKPGVLDQVDLDTTFAFERSLAQLSGKVDLRKHPLLTFQGEADLDAKRLFDGEQWKDGAVRGELALARFDLSGLRGMEPRLARISGAMWGTGTLAGTFAHPVLQSEVSASDLELGGDRFEQAHAEASYRERRFSLQGTAAQARGGKLVAAASWSRAADAPLALSLRARRVDIGFLASASEEVTSLAGEVDAELTVGGTRAAPKPDGFLTIDRASLGLRGKATTYRHGALDARITAGRARLKVDVESGEGSMSASGSARIDGVEPTQLELNAHARQFALVYGSFAARLDADFALFGDRASGQWTGRLDLHRGTINLPDLSTGDQAQPLGELSDVTYSDGRVERLAQGRAAKGHWLAARIVGPLQLRSHELNLDLTSDVAVTVVPGKTSANGLVNGTNGTVELFGHSYRLEAAEVRFHGPLDDPALNIRATRKSGEATLIVTVSGTVLSPQVSLSADPPRYDQAQLVGLVLAGSTRQSSAAISFRELNRQIGGLLSNAILHKIREQMAALLPTETFEPVDDKSSARFALSPLEVGRYVSDRVYVSYEHQFGATIGRSAVNANESQIKVRLPHGGQLESAVGDAGVAGLYLYWAYRY